MNKKNIIIFAVCLGLILIPFIVNGNAAYEGADGMAEEVIIEINAEYEPWAESLWEPPSGEVESLLFCLQAAIGGIFIGYFIGKKSNDTRSKTVCIHK